MELRALSSKLSWATARGAWASSHEPTRRRRRRGNNLRQLQRFAVTSESTVATDPETTLGELAEILDALLSSFDVEL